MIHRPLPAAGELGGRRHSGTVREPGDLRGEKIWTEEDKTGFETFLHGVRLALFAVVFLAVAVTGVLIHCFWLLLGSVPESGQLGTRAPSGILYI